MTYEEVVKLDAYRSWFELEATFQSGAKRYWATAYVLGSTGLRHGILRVGQLGFGIPESPGSPPERISVTVEVIDDGSGDLKDLLAGTTGGSAGSEYTGDSVLNMTAVLYHGVQDPLSPYARLRKAVTPTLHLVGDVEFNGQRAVLPLGSVDDDVLGKSYRSFTVRQLRDSAEPAAPVDIVWANNQPTTGSGVEPSATWLEHVAVWDTGLDERVPWVYGPADIPLLALVSTATYGNKGWNGIAPAFLVGAFDVSKPPPVTQEDFRAWKLYRDDVDNPWGNQLPFRKLFRAKRKVTLDDGTTTEVYVLWIESVADKFVMEGTHTAQPALRTMGLGAGTSLSAGDSGAGKVIEEMVKDHSALGAAALDSASFTRTKRAVKALGVGGVYRGDSPLSDPLSLIAEASGIGLWTSAQDGRLHALPSAAWSTDDQAGYFAATLPHIRQEDVIGRWAEIIPRDPDRRGAVPSKLELRWSAEQEKFYKLTYLYRSAPGATSLPIGRAPAAEIDASWIIPRFAAYALGNVAARRGFITRRIRAAVALWVATYEPGTIFAVTHRLGLEVSAGDGVRPGYVARPMRLERGVIDPDAGTFEAVFEDLGQLVNVKPWRIDAASNWIFATPGAQSLSLVNGSDVVNASAPFFTAPASDWEGRYLDTSGAPTQSNRRQTKIVTWVSNTQVVVEFQFNATESVPAGTIPNTTLPKWCVVRAHSKEVAGYRSAYGRSSLPNGLMRNGDAGWQLTGG